MDYHVDTEVDRGVTPAMASYPPKVIDLEILDYVRDVGGLWQSRDIGRSALFAGRYYYIFGDTFCKDKNNEFVGLVSTTIATVDDPNKPLITSYPSTDSKGKIDAFIKLNEEEESLELSRGIRTTFWCFGGMVETSPEVGWVWFEKGEQDGEDGSNIPCGAGIAQVVIDQETGLLRTIRAKELIFTQFEPRFGGFCTLLEGDFIYLFAYHGEEIVLARVSRHQPFVRDAYTFWNGSEYVKEIDTKGVLFNMQHGAIIKSTLFGPERPWLFVGCTRWGDSKVMVGAAARIEGPWELTAVCDAFGIDFPEDNMYCMYPHQWAFDEAKGELMVTWSEHWPGGVVAARLRFEMKNQTYWRIIPVNHYSYAVRRWVMPGGVSAEVTKEQYGVDVYAGGRPIREGMRAPDGVAPLHICVEGEDWLRVQEATNRLEFVLAVKGKEEVEDLAAAAEERERQKAGRNKFVKFIARISSPHKSQ